MVDRTTARGDRYFYVQLLKTVHAILPDDLQDQLVRLGGDIAARASTGICRMIAQNGSLLFGTLGSSQKKQLIRDTCSSYVSYLLSFVRAGRCNGPSLLRRLEGVGCAMEARDLSDTKRPVLAVSLHYGFYELGAVWLQSFFSEVVLPVLSSRDDRQNAYRERVRRRWNVRTVYTHQLANEESFRSGMKNLFRPGQVVGMTGDPPGGRLDNREADPLDLNGLFYEAVLYGVRNGAVLLPILVLDEKLPARVKLYEPILCKRGREKAYKTELHETRNALWDQFRPELKKRPNLWFRFR